MSQREPITEYEQGYEAGLADALDNSDITPTYEEGYSDGYDDALADAHAAIAIKDGVGSQEEALEIIEELIDNVTV